MLSLDRWDFNVKQVCGGFHTEPHRCIPFVGDIRLQDMGGLEIAYIETNARKISKIATSLQDDRHYFVILQQQGTMVFSDNNKEQLLLNPGEMAIVNSAVNYSMYPQGLVKQMSVHIPKSVLEQFSGAKKVSFSRLNHYQPSGEMLLTLLRQLSYDRTAVSSLEGEGKAIQQAISALVLPNLSLDDGFAEISLKELAKRHIGRLLPEERLCPDRLAQEMDISKRTLYRLFAEDGVSVSRLILQMRIDKCCEQIIESDRLSKSTSFTEVAFRWGFSDASQFSRSFKRIKGVTPSVWRERSRLN